MPLNLTSHFAGDVVVIRCKGRIAAGDDVDALQQEFEKQIPKRTKVVLQLAETAYVDSSGLGALVRVLNVLRGAGGDLRLCELPPGVHGVLQVTNLLSVFLTYPTENEAVERFSQSARSSRDTLGPPINRTKIVCVDTSRDVLAYVAALLKRAGYEVFTTRALEEAATLVYSKLPHLIICGPGVLTLPAGAAAVKRFRDSKPPIPVLVLPPDFSSAEAGQAALDLVDRVRSLLEN